MGRKRKMRTFPQQEAMLEAVSAGLTRSCTVNGSNKLSSVAELTRPRIFLINPIYSASTSGKVGQSRGILSTDKGSRFPKSHLSKLSS